MPAENVTLWSSETFTGPFVDGVIAHSSEIPNTNSLNSIDVTINYEAITPDGKDVVVGFVVQAVLEEEVSDGIWVPMAIQLDPIKGTDEALQQVLVVSPQLVLDPGTPEKVWQGNREVAAISRHDRVLPSKVRVCLYEQGLNNGHPDLTSITISGWARKHNRV
jgi:hypothetical protein